MERARLAELEAALAESFDREHLAVYGDYLQSIGDPRGELVALDLHGGDHRARKRELVALAAVESAPRPWLRELDLSGCARARVPSMLVRLPWRGQLKRLRVPPPRDDTERGELTRAIAGMPHVAIEIADASPRRRR